MNYGELKSEIISLGFSDTSEYTEFGNVIYDSINRAITEINTSVSPIVEKYEFEIDTADTGVMYIDFTTVVSGFIDFDKTPVLYEKDNTQMYVGFSEFDIERGNTLVINADEHKGNFRVYYVKKHTAITSETTDTTDLELPLKSHILVPLLSAYYIWLEDEQAKAVMYHTKYENLRQEIYSRPRLKIIGGL